MNQMPNCLPDKMLGALKENLAGRTLDIHLTGGLLDKECGDSFVVPNRDGSLRGEYVALNVRKLWDDGNVSNGNDGCGCLDSVILHELLHWGGNVGDSPEEELRGNSCELKCMQNSGNPDCLTTRTRGADPCKCVDK